MTISPAAEGPAPAPARRIRFARTLTALATSLALVVAAPAVAPALADDDPTPVTVVAPSDATLTGDLVVDGVVSVSSSPWTPDTAHLDYAWWSSDAPYVAPAGDGTDPNTGAVQIADATASELTLTADLVGKYVWAKVTGTADGFAPADIVAAASSPVAEASFASLPAISIAGSTVVGAKLSAALSEAAPADAVVTYRWQREGTDIPDAVGSTYTVAPGDLDRSLNVVATFAKPGYITESRPSDAVHIGTGTMTTAPVPTLAGGVRVDGVVTARPGAWPAGTTFTYRWRLTNAKNVTSYIPSAAAATFRPTAAMRGQRLSVVVTGTALGYGPVAKTSGSTTIGYGVFTAAPVPKISGGAYVGSKLSVVRGTWSPAAAYSYQWKRNGAKISGATKSTYKVTSKDVGKKVTVTVTAKRAAYTTVAKTSAATTRVTRPFAKSYAPTISGTMRVGSTLKASVKAWSPRGTYIFMWYRNGQPIVGGMSKTYRLTEKDLGATITVKVSGTASGYYATTRTSAGKKLPIPTTMARDGLFQVGKQIAAGTYVATGGSACWFERRSDANVGSSTGLLGWQYAYDESKVWGGQKVVTISSSDKYFYTKGCGTFRPAATSLKTSVKDGTWIVGKDIKAGTWELVGPVTTSCVIIYLKSFTGDTSIDITDGYDTLEKGDRYKVFASDKGFITSGCGTWKRIGN